MLKVNGINSNEEVKEVRKVKYYISSSQVKQGSVIPIALDGMTITSVPIQELGKQLLDAVSDGNAEEVKTLLNHGAHFTSDWLGISPLHVAAQKNYIEIVEILLRSGISKDARTKVDRTPLHMAVYEGHLGVVDQLVKHGADINSKDLLGMTPLHWAVQNGHLDIVEYLVSNGCELNEVNRFGLTPLKISRQTGRVDIEQLLMTAMMDVTVATENLVEQLAADETVFEPTAEKGTDTEDLDENMDLDDCLRESIILPIEPHILEQLDCNVTGGREYENSQALIGPAMLDQLDCNVTGRREFENSQTLIDVVANDTGQFAKEQPQQLPNGNHEESSHMTVPLTLLQDSNTLLNDESEESNILNAAMNNGHSVVLTEAGKVVLNSLNQTDQQQVRVKKKIVTITAEELLAMSNSSSNKNVVRLEKLPGTSQIRRIVVKKRPAAQENNVKVEKRLGVNKDLKNNDIDTIMNELMEAKQTIEEYKIKLKEKEQEVENYKMHLRLLMDPNS